MLFNSLEFVLFLPLVFLLYWSLHRTLRWQNLFVVFASYVFYGWWDWRFLLLIALTTFSSYQSGKLIEKYEGNRMGQKSICVTNIVLNIAILAIFKYFNFFAENVVNLFHVLGWEADSFTIDVILPVGISFYTFQSIGYTIDVYQHRIKANHNIVAFFAFVSFFPQLVAGPIERATHLLPQFLQKRHFDYARAVGGLRLILWGFFKKMVIADNCAIVVNSIFADYGSQSGIELMLGAFLFAFQIYGDFSGYSDIAIGTARLFGIDLMRNFNYPYFSRNIVEFWRRWHISLTTWFRDYIYIPMGGNRGSKLKVMCNTLLVFGVSGIWHGANWTFICWGLYHALLFVPFILFPSLRRKYDNSVNLEWKERCVIGLQTLVTFFLVMLGWVFFRSESMGQAVDYLVRMCTQFELVMPLYGKRCVLWILVLLAVETLLQNQRHWQWLMESFLFKKRFCRWCIYYILLIVILNFSAEKATFIYFQF